MELSVAVEFDGWLAVDASVPAGEAAGSLEEESVAGGAEAEESPEGLAFTSSDELPAALEPAGAGSPGFTVSTTPDLPDPEPIVDRLPPERTSEFAEASVSGSIVGKPCAAAVWMSGPLWSMPRGL